MNKYAFSFITFSIAIFPFILSGQFDVSPKARLVGPSSGSATYTVNSLVGWSVTDDAAWITASKTNGSTITVTYSTNFSTSSRTAHITASGTGGVSETVTLKQEGALPYIDVNPKDMYRGPEAGTSTYSVSSNVGWSVSDDASWLTSSKTSGTTISASYSANNSNAERIAYILATGTGGAYQTVSLHQEAAFISFNAPPNSISAAQGSQNVEVYTNLTQWTVSDNASWLTVSREGGTDLIKLSWEANPFTSPRTVRITVSGGGGITKTNYFDLTQQGVVASLDVNPKDIYRGPEAGTATYSVTSNIGWSVSDDATWLTSSKTNGSTISVSYTANNSNAERIAYILAKGNADAYQTVSLRQEAAYISFSGPPSSINAAQGSQNVQLFTNLTSWTVSDNASWLSVSREGETDWINLVWEANPSTSSRTVRITVTGTGGITETDYFDLTQQGATPFFAVSPDNRITGPESGTTTYFVSTNVGWSVSDDASWLTATKTSGSTISVSYNTNNSGNDRLANISATGSGGLTETVSLHQEAAIISFSGPPSSISAAQGSENVQVYTNLTQWTVSDDASWLSASRAGETDWITLNWEANPSTSTRKVIITVTGSGEITESSSMTITQQGAAPSIKVNPDNLTVSHESGSAVFDVNSNVGWSVSSGAAWLSASKTNGSAFSVSYEANSKTTDRYADIIATGTGGVSSTARITQAGIPFIDFEPESLNVGYLEGKELITIQSNVNWNVTDDATWLKTSKTGDMLEIYYDGNPVASSRMAHISVTGDGIKKTITLEQAALIVELDIGISEEKVTAESGTINHYIVTNSNLWSVGTSAPWLKASRIGKDLINVIYESNTSIDSRSAAITVDATGGVKGSFKITQEAALPYLKVDPEFKNLHAGSGTGTCSVQSNLNWDVTCDASWLTVSKLDENTFSFSHDANPSTSERVTSVLVKGTGGYSDELTVTQAGTEQSLEVNPESERVDAASGTITIEVRSNLEWDLTEDVDWFTAHKKDANTILVSYEENIATSLRSGEIIVSGATGTKLTVNITQAGALAFLEVNPEGKSVDANTGTATFSVNSNEEWSVSGDASWLTIQKEDETSFRVSYEANEGIFPRLAHIFVQGSGGTISTLTLTQASQTITFDVSPKKLIVDAGAGERSFSVSSNIEWGVSADAAWMNVHKTGESIFSVSYEANSEFEDRNAPILVFGTGGITEIVTLSQAAAQFYLEVDTLIRSLGPRADSTFIRVQSNTDWSVFEEADWLSAAKSGDSILIVYFDENTGAENRKDSIIISGDGVTSQTIIFVQESEGATEIRNPDIQEQFTVYPNPSQDQLFIKSGSDFNSRVILSVFNASGRLILERQMDHLRSGDVMEIDLRGHYPGVYILHLNHPESISTFRIIKL